MIGQNWSCYCVAGGCLEAGVSLVLTILFAERKFYVLWCKFSFGFSPKHSFKNTFKLRRTASSSPSLCSSSFLCELFAASYLLPGYFWGYLNFTLIHVGMFPALASSEWRMLQCSESLIKHIFLQYQSEPYLILHAALTLVQLTIFIIIIILMYISDFLV